MFYQPERILLLGFLCYLLVFFVSPLQPRVEIHSGSLVFIGLSCLAFIIGCQLDNILVVTRRLIPATVQQAQKAENDLFRAVFFVGLLGNTIRLYDKYVARGVGNLTGFEAREALLESSASSLSLVGAALYPFGYIPLFLYLGSKIMPKNKLRFLLCLGLFLIPAIDALVLFSRSFMLVSLSMIYFGASITMFRGQALPARLILPGFIGLTFVATLSVILFSWRLGEMELDVLDSIFLSGYGYAIVPNAFAVDLFETSGFGSGLLAGILPIAQYFTHSIFEFQILWEDAPIQIHSSGALHFAPYMKILSIVGIGSQPDLWQLFPRVGIFTSFFGPLWVDFGWFSIFVMLIFGIVVRHIARMAQAGDIGAFPLYTYFCIVLFFAPVVNFIISAQGMYNITAFTIFLILSRRSASLQIMQGTK